MALPLGRRRVALSSVAILLVLSASCTTSETRVPPAPQAVSPRGLRASITQNRFDEASGALLAGITNQSHRTIRVTRASIRWAGFSWPQVAINPVPVMPGQTAPFHISPGRAHCQGTVTASPVLSATVDGAALRLPLSVDLPGLLDQLRRSACAGQALSAAARVTLTISAREVTRRGAPYFRGAINLERTPGSHTVVSVVATLGSVLFDVLPARPLPDRLRASTARLRVPVVVGPTRRCDPHARGQASQPFLFAVFTRLGTEPQHRTITVPTPAEQRRLNRLLDRSCR